MTCFLFADGTRTLAEFRTLGGLGEHDSASLIALAAEADLRGRGGAGFPFARKLSAVAESVDPVRIAIANGEEGEPGSVKDRVLMRTKPHLVLDGLRLAASAVGAQRSIVYVSDIESAVVLRAVIANEGSSFGSIEVFEVPPAYVAGEETAAVRAIDGGPALPTAKPPRPFEAGVGGHPTLIANVETLAQFAMLAARGASEFGRGTLLSTVHSSTHSGALVEVPVGTPMREVLALVTPIQDVRAILTGGLFGGVQPAALFDVALEHDALRAAGSALGCAAFHVVSASDCVVELVTDAMSFLGRESAQQCGSCLKGTAAMAAAMRRIAAGDHADTDVEALGRWAVSLRGRGNCALLDAACQMLSSLLEHWRLDLESHAVGHGCELCRARVIADDFAITRLRVPPTLVPLSLEGITT